MSDLPLDWGHKHSSLPHCRYISAPVLGPGFDGGKANADAALQLHTECQPFTLHAMRRPTNLDKVKAEVATLSNLCMATRTHWKRRGSESAISALSCP